MFASDPVILVLEKNSKKFIGQNLANLKPFFNNFSPYYI